VLEQSISTRHAPFLNTKLRMKALLIIFITALSLQAFAGPLQCSDLFQNSFKNIVHDLATLRLRLDLAKAQGARSASLTALAADYQNKERLLIAYVENEKIMTRAELFQELRQQIKEIQWLEQNQKNQIEQAERDEAQQRQKRRRQTAQGLKVDGTVTLFHRIEPGKFLKGEPKQKIELELTRPFDIASTLTTQMLWTTIARLANLKLIGYHIDEDPSEHKGPLRPVESVSVLEIKTWIKALNELSQLGEPELEDLFPDQKKGDVYRMPTETEWEFVIRGRGIYNDLYFFGNDPKLLANYAWFCENSNKTTHPVGEKLPLDFEGKKFYDMLGNVAEFVDDLTGPRNGPVDPKRLRDPRYKHDYYLHRGGTFEHRSDTTTSDIMGFWDNNKGAHHIGFRLARNPR
jgi:formylglycine-generating enzyme required for sulfatase activity